MDEQKKGAVARGSNHASDSYCPTSEFKKYCKENWTDYEREA